LPHVPNLGTKRAHPVLRGVVDCARDHLGVRIVSYAAEKGRLDLLVEAEDHEALTRGMKGFSIRLSRALNRLMSREGKVIADRYESRLLTSADQVQASLAALNGSTTAGASAGTATPKSRLLRGALRASATSSILPER
jgi:hypothetical protein